MIRLFIAHSLPVDVRSGIAMLQSGIDGARWVPSADLHITLRFIGDVSQNTAEEIAHTLGYIKPARFSIRLLNTGHFSSRGRVRALWVGVEKTPELLAMRDKIDRRLTGIGLPPEGRKFAPHVTVARLRPARSDRVLQWLETSGGFRFPAYEVNSFILYQSHLGRFGPTYVPLAEYPLDNVDIVPSKVSQG